MNLLKQLFGIKASRESEGPNFVMIPPVNVDPQIDEILKKIGFGEATTFCCYGSDTELFRLRLTSDHAYVNSAKRPYFICGVTNTDKSDSMIVAIATITEHAANSAANRSGGPIEQMERKLFSPEDFMKLRPVNAFSNYALPGFSLLSRDGFNSCVAKLKTGAYRVVLPCDTNDAEKSVNMRDADTLVSTVTREEQNKANLVTDFQSMKVRCNASCKKEWSLSQCSDVSVTDKEILFRCPECGRNCWHNR
jgi:hypothetical protein